MAGGGGGGGKRGRGRRPGEGLIRKEGRPGLPMRRATR